MKLRSLALLATLLLAGCAGLAPREDLSGAGDADVWRSHRGQVAGIDAWQIAGKVGIRAPQDSGSGTLFWLQRQDYYDIRLSGPLGRGAARLTGREGDILLEVANQGRYRAASPRRCWRSSSAGACRSPTCCGGCAACRRPTARAA